jgi:predicted molibdopterin-dependent oxidoreductase YjgC
MVYMPFHFREASANVLTIDALDPIAKIPEFKVCAVKLTKVTAPTRPRRKPKPAKAKARKKARARA